MAAQRKQSGAGGRGIDAADGAAHGIIIQAPRAVPPRTLVHAYLWEGTPTAEWPVVIRTDGAMDSPLG